MTLRITRQLRGYPVQGRSNREIEGVATLMRTALQLPRGPIDMGPFIERMNSEGITYDMVEDKDHSILVPGVEATYYPDGDEDPAIPGRQTGVIVFRNSVYVEACGGDPRARFTVAHEYGHAFLGHRRTFNRVAPGAHYPWNDSEAQANAFAAAFLMPTEQIEEEGLRTSLDIARYFGVSRPAAAFRLNNVLGGSMTR